MNTSTGISTLDGLCALTGDSDTFRDAKNLACWCKKNSSSDNRYVGTDNISC